MTKHEIFYIMVYSWDVLSIQYFYFQKIKHLSLTVESDATRGPCGSKTSHAWG